MKTHPLSSSSLWDFSLALYPQAGVADCCLQLQDEQGANVNILLWCSWLGAKGYLLDKSQLAEAQALIYAWDQNYILPLRQLRRQMKAEFGVNDVGVEAVRSSIKQAELQAERQLQYWLEQQAQLWNSAPDSDTEKTIRANVDCYLSALGVAAHMIELAANVLIAAFVLVTQQRR